MNRNRPGRAKEQLAREVVRQSHPLATSHYTPEGAEVFDPETNDVLGRATSGDWAVELAWQDAALTITQENMTEQSGH